MREHPGETHPALGKIQLQRWFDIRTRRAGIVQTCKKKKKIINKSLHELPAKDPERMEIS